MLQVWLTCASHSKTHTPIYYGLKGDYIQSEASQSDKKAFIWFDLFDYFKYNHKTGILLQK